MYTQCPNCCSEMVSVPKERLRCVNSRCGLEIYKPQGSEAERRLKQEQLRFRLEQAGLKED